MPKIVFTGHRPIKIGGNNYLKSPLGLWVKKEIKNILTSKKCDEVVVGGAQGTDTLAAHCCIELKIPYRVYVPFYGYQQHWPTMAQIIFSQVIQMAQEVVYVHEGPAYDEKWKTAALLQDRNIAMIKYIYDDDPLKNILGSVYNGCEEGGTYNCLLYAKKHYRSLRRININPFDFKPIRA